MSVRRRGFVILLALVLALAWLAGRPPAPLPPPPLETAPAPEARRPAPDWSLRDVAGGTAELGDFAGRVLLLNFWATWCGPCRRELPALQVLHEALAEEGLAVVAVSVDAGSPDPVARFAAGRGVTFPVLHDPGEEAAHDYGTIAWPTTFVIDRAGRVVQTVPGAWDWSAPGALAWLRDLSAQ